MRRLTPVRELDAAQGEGIVKDVTFHDHVVCVCVWSVCGEGLRYMAYGL